MRNQTPPKQILYHMKCGMEIQNSKSHLFWIQQCHLLWHNYFNSLIKWVWFSRVAIGMLGFQWHSDVILWLNLETHSNGNWCLAEKHYDSLKSFPLFFSYISDKKLTNKSCRWTTTTAFQAGEEMGIPCNLLFKTNSSFLGFYSQRRIDEFLLKHHRRWRPVTHQTHHFPVLSFSSASSIRHNGDGQPCLLFD